MSLKLGCIADDFTGGTDLANNLVRAGMRTVQVIGAPEAGTPTPADVDAVVVALKSRTAPVAQAVAESLAAARWLPAVVVSLPVALLIAGTAAFALGGAVVGTILPQIGASLIRPADAPGTVVNGLISMVITILVLVGFLTFPLGLALIGIWVIYRVARGWLTLRDGRPMEMPTG